MAAITITEILGGDNIAGSRLTINDNFKKLGNSLNTLETFLNTSPAGGLLTVGEVTVLRYSNPETKTLISCQGAGVFAGDLTTSKALSGASANVTAALTVGGNVTFNGAATGGGSFTTSEAVPANINGALKYGQMFSVTALDPSSLSPSSAATRAVTDAFIANRRVLSIDLSTYTGTGNTNCNILQLPAVGTAYQGQILTIIIGTKSPTATNVVISPTNFAPGLNTGITFTGATADTVYNQAVTLFGGPAGWRILNATGVTIA